MICWLAKNLAPHNFLNVFSFFGKLVHQFYEFEKKNNSVSVL